MGIFEQSRYYFNYTLPNIIASNLIGLDNFLSDYWWIFAIFALVFFAVMLRLYRRYVQFEMQVKRFEEFFRGLSSKSESKDIESVLLRSGELVKAKYGALYALRGETYIFLNSNISDKHGVSAPLRLSKKEIARFKKSGNYGICYFQSSSLNTLLLFFSKSVIDAQGDAGFFELMLGFYEQSINNFESKGSEALSNVSKETSLSLLKLQMDRDQFFKFFIALILKITKAKGAKLFTKEGSLVFEHMLDQSSFMQKVFFIRNTPYKLEFYDSKPIKNDLMGQIGSFLDMAGGFLTNLSRDSKMVQNYLKLLEFTNEAIELENIYYKNHSRIVQIVSVELAKSLFLSENQIDAISMGSFLHDIGMIGDLLAVLNKDALDDKDKNLIKEHPIIGSIIVEPIGHIYPIGDIIKYHHERFDGKGYPFALQGAQIPVEAQVVALGEFYAGVTGDRAYKAGKSHEEAVDEIKKLSNKMFSKVMVDAFVDVERSIKTKIEKIKTKITEAEGA
jgi:HD-GYP domain-containing protein (c-di-GMP phosphodiesterase class II)